MGSASSGQADAAARTLVPIEHFDVSGLPEDERFAALVAANPSSRMQRLSDGPFAAQARFWRMGQQVWVDQVLDPLEFVRDEQLARSIPATHYSLIVVLDGECTLVRATGDVVCTTDDVIVTDVSRPERSRTTRFHSLHIRIPKQSLDAIVPPARVHGRLPRGAATRLFATHARAIAAAIPTLDQHQAALLAVGTCHHLAAALADVPAIADADPGDVQRERVKHYIARQPNGAISVAAICTALGITRSTLYRAFTAEGGVLAYDRKRRLTALHQALADPLEHRSIAALGADFGFVDKGHLSRAFREEFGYSPSQLRDHAHGQPYQPIEPGSVQDQFRDAIRSFGR